MLMNYHFIFVSDKLSLVEDIEDDGKMGQRIFIGEKYHLSIEIDIICSLVHPTI